MKFDLKRLEDVKPFLERVSIGRVTIQQADNDLVVDWGTFVPRLNSREDMTIFSLEPIPAAGSETSVAFNNRLHYLEGINTPVLFRE